MLHHYICRGLMEWEGVVESVVSKSEKQRDNELKSVKLVGVENDQEDIRASKSQTSTYGKCTCASQKYLQNDHSYRTSS